jgi:hypothetical protein
LEQLTLQMFVRKTLMMKIRVLFFNFSLRRGFGPYLPITALALYFITSPLQAQFLVRPVNLAYLSQRADVVVQGRVANAVHESLPGYPNIPTVKVTLKVENMMRGPTGDTYTFREVFVGLRARVGGKRYTPGQQLLLFLTAPSKYGLSSPVGIEQGRFHITRYPGSSPTIINEQSNIGLFRNVAEAARMAGRPLTESQLRIASSERGPVQLNEFISMVQNLMRLPRIR